MNSKLRCLLGLSVLFVSASSVAANWWTYTGKGSGTGNWGQISPACAKAGIQSPIDITEPLTKEKLPLTVHYAYTTFNLVKNQHNLYLYNESPANDTITLGQQTYQLQQIHFHVPAEHTINSKQYALEMHIVNADRNGHFVAIAVLFDIGLENPLIKKILSLTPNPGHSKQFTFDPSLLLPENRQFYSYEGTLTVPPCSPVTWIIMETPLTVSNAEIDAFKKKVMPMNARPIQPRDSREIVIAK